MPEQRTFYRNMLKSNTEPHVNTDESWNPEILLFCYNIISFIKIIID